MKPSPAQHICVLGLEESHHSPDIQGHHLSHGSEMCLSLCGPVLLLNTPLYFILLVLIDRHCQISHLMMQKNIDKKGGNRHHSYAGCSIPCIIHFLSSVIAY